MRDARGGHIFPGRDPLRARHRRDAVVGRRRRVRVRVRVQKRVQPRGERPSAEGRGRASRGARRAIHDRGGAEDAPRGVRARERGVLYRGPADESSAVAG